MIGIVPPLKFFGSTQIASEIGSKSTDCVVCDQKYIK